MPLLCLIMSIRIRCIQQNTNALIHNGKYGLLNVCLSIQVHVEHVVDYLI